MMPEQTRLSPAVPEVLALTELQPTSLVRGIRGFWALVAELH
jgi:hypothetical protein